MEAGVTLDLMVAFKTSDVPEVPLILSNEPSVCVPPSVRDASNVE